MLIPSIPLPFSLPPLSKLLLSASMEHHNIIANNNGEAESSNVEFERSIILIRDLPKGEMEKLMIDLAKRKNSGRSLEPYTINEVNLYDFGPDELAANVLEQNGVDEWFFFTRKKKIYLGGVNMKRKAGDGVWTGNAAYKPIYDGEEITGYRKYYYYVYSKGETTNLWRHYEYDPVRITDGEQLDGYVLCKLYKMKPREPSNERAKSKAAEGSSSQQKSKKAAKRDTINLQVVQDKNQPLNEISFPHDPVHKFPVITNPTYHVVHNDHHSQIQPLNANQGLSQLPTMTGNHDIHNNNTDQNLVDILNDTDNPGPSDNMFTSAGLISEDQLLDTDDFINDMPDFPANQNATEFQNEMENFDLGVLPGLDTLLDDFLSQP